MEKEKNIYCEITSLLLLNGYGNFLCHPRPPKKTTTYQQTNQKGGLCLNIENTEKSFTSIKKLDCSRKINEKTQIHHSLCEVKTSKKLG